MMIACVVGKNYCNIGDLQGKYRNVEFNCKLCAALNRVQRKTRL